MDDSIKKAIEQCAKSAYAGRVTFGEVVGALMKENVESYHADYRTHDTTYYMQNGGSHRVAMPVPEAVISPTFDVPLLQKAIRAAQRDEVRYPDFLRLSMAAGCIGYIVWITGRHVVYFGRHGERHIEQFPS